MSVAIAAVFMLDCTAIRFDDRPHESTGRHRGASFKRIIDLSTAETLSRPVQSSRPIGFSLVAFFDRQHRARDVLLDLHPVSRTEGLDRRVVARPLRRAKPGTQALGAARLT